MRWGPLCLLGAIACTDAIEIVLEGPWPSELDTVALAFDGNAPAPGTPLYVAPGGVVRIELRGEEPGSIELRRFKARRPGDQDLAQCGIQLGDAHPIEREIEDAWTTGPFETSGAIPALRVDEARPLRALSTDGPCDRLGCERIRVDGLTPRLGPGTFVRVLNRNVQLVAFVVLPDGKSTFYRSDGETLVPGDGIGAHPDPERYVIDLGFAPARDLLLYDNGEIWSRSANLSSEHVFTASGATQLASNARIAYAYGSGLLWELGTSSAPIAGLPISFRAGIVGPDDTLFGVALGSVQSWREGRWNIEHRRAGLEQRGSFGATDAEIAFFGEDIVLIRKPDGTWMEEQHPARFPLNGGSLHAGAYLGYGEGGSLIYRSAQDQPWCEIPSGTNLQLTVSTPWKDGFVVGISNDGEGSGLLRVTP